MMVCYNNPLSFSLQHHKNRYIKSIFNFFLVLLILFLFIDNASGQSSVPSDTLIHHWETDLGESGTDTVQTTPGEMDTLTIGITGLQVPKQDTYWFWDSSPYLSQLYDNLLLFPEETRVKLFGPDYHEKFDNNGQVDEKEIRWALTRDYHQNDHSLPVDLLFFTGAYDPIRDRVRLKWATASELQSLNFELYRSIISPSGQNLEKGVYIAAIEAAGNSSVRHDYEFVDDLPAGLESGSRIEYVLWQNDIDGSRHNKGSVLVVYNNVLTAEAFRIGLPYGNPFNPAGFKLPLTVPEDGWLEIEYSDMLGRQGKLPIQQISKNTAFISIQLPKRLVSGVYIFMIIYRRSDGTLIGTETFKAVYVK